MARLNQRGVRHTTRPSGHNIKPSFGKVDSGGSIPPNAAVAGASGRKTGKRHCPLRLELARSDDKGKCWRGKARRPPHDSAVRPQATASKFGCGHDLILTGHTPSR